jgi:spoIIIJ-associated protein
MTTDSPVAATDDDALVSDPAAEVEVTDGAAVADSSNVDSDVDPDDSSDESSADSEPTRAGSDGEAATDNDEGTLLEREGDIAADYLEVLLDIADMDGDIDIDVEGDRAAVSVVGDGLDKLVGTNGATLDALQELTRLAVHRETGVRSRLMLDVGGHRARRRAELSAQGAAAAERVASSGEVERLAPMTPFERKIVHDAVATVAGVDTESEGEEPERYVVIRPV